MKERLLLYLLFSITGFFLGSILFSEWIPRLFFKKDIRALSDDHNPGAANVFLHCGPMVGMLCLLLDMLKGFLPVFFAWYFLGEKTLWFSLVMVSPVLGHAVAPLSHFQGGKCIATSFGVLLALLPFSRIVLLLAALYILFSTVFKIQPHRRRSLFTFGLFALLSLPMLCVRQQFSLIPGCLGIAAIAIVRHWVRHKPVALEEEQEPVEAKG